MTCLSRRSGARARELALEEVLARAWRGDETVREPEAPQLLLRSHGGLTQRANSALWTGGPLNPDALDLARRWYAARGLPALLQDAGGTTDAGRPTGVAVVVMTAEAGRIAPPDPPAGYAVEVLARPTASMVAALAARQGGDPAATARAEALLCSAPDGLFAVARTADGAGPGAEVGAARLGLVPDASGWWGVLDAVAVVPAHRRRGLADTLIRTLARAGRARDAALRLALEVEVPNAGARACYDRLGFVEHHRHAYRRLD